MNVVVVVMMMMMLFEGVRKEEKHGKCEMGLE